MKLSISNIAWQADQDADVYELMKKYGFSGLEIAPTRLFPENPYGKLSEAAKFSKELKAREGFKIPSMQSIWFGKTEKLFGSEEERNTLFEYTKQAIDWAEVIGCGNLVFGCPRNRFLPEDVDSKVAFSFFRELGQYALSHHTSIGMEANPPIYNTNYINSTPEAIDLVESVDSEGFGLNLDIGTVIQNSESIEELTGKVHLINHVHISEPGLGLIERRELHRELKTLLESENYNGFISIEMSKREKLEEIEKTLRYVAEVFW